MAKKKPTGESGGDEIEVPFEQEKEKFMGMIGDVLENQEFSSPEEMQKFLSDAFTGRTMSNSISEWDTRPPSALDDSRLKLNSLSEESSPETKRRIAKKALEITPDCMEAWLTLALSYRSPAKIEETLLEGVEHGRKLHADLIETIEEDCGLWGFHETRPFLRLMESLAEFYREEGPLERCVEVLEEMIALNPEDNQGIRGQLLHHYTCLRRFDDAEKLSQRYDDDFDLGIVYGRVLLELLKIVDAGHDFQDILKKSEGGQLPPAAFGPEFVKAKALMKEALEVNPYVPVLFSHPKSLYVQAPMSYQLKSPEQAVIFINEFGIVWLETMIGMIFLFAYEKQSKIRIRKASRNRRESYKELIECLDGIDQPPWHSVALEELREL